MDRKLADDIIEKLRFGRPPQRGVNAYTAGNEILQVQRRHLNLRREGGGNSDLSLVLGLRKVTFSPAASRSSFWSQLYGLFCRADQR